MIFSSCYSAVIYGEYKCNGDEKNERHFLKNKGQYIDGNYIDLLIYSEFYSTTPDAYLSRRASLFMARMADAGTDRARILGSVAVHLGYKPADDNGTFHIPNFPVPPLHHCGKRRDG